MNKVPLHNKGSGLMYGLVDGHTRLINPGETVMVDAPTSMQMVDPNKGGVIKPPAPFYAAEVLKGKIADISLEGLDEAQLNELLDGEQKSAQPRSTLVKAIQERLLAVKAGQS